MLIYNIKQIIHLIYVWKAMKKKKILKLIIYLTIFFLLPINYGFAYLDPGTGNILLQIIAAVAASAAIFFGFIWTKIKLFYLKIKEKITKKKADGKN